MYRILFVKYWKKKMKKFFIIAAAFVPFVAEGIVVDKTVFVPDTSNFIASEEFINRKDIEEIRFLINSRTSCIFPYAFMDCSSLKTLHIPSSLNWLSEGCFRQCTSLEYVYFKQDSRIHTIENDAFLYCRSLKTIHIPRSVIVLGDSCFLGCTDLRSVYFDTNSKIWNIMTGAFDECTALEIVNFGFSPVQANYFNAVDLNVFNPKLEPMSIPEGVESLCERHFRIETSLKSIFVPAGMKILHRQGGFIGIDNSTPSDDFAMIRIEEGQMSAFRIPSSLYN
jgi:hypothetical protein